MRTATRPATSKSRIASTLSGTGTRGATAHAHNNIASGNATAIRIMRRRLFLDEPADRLLQLLAVGMLPQRIAPDALRLVARALRPQHFAEMGGDFGVLPLLEGAAQITHALLELAEPVFRPAHAVENEGVVGRELQRLLDVIARFAQSIGAVRKRVAEGIPSLRVVRLERDELAQTALRHVEAVELFRRERNVVEQVRLVGLALERLPEHLVGFLVTLDLAQHLRFGLDQRHP